MYVYTSFYTSTCICTYIQVWSLHESPYIKILCANIVKGVCKQSCNHCNVTYKKSSSDGNSSSFSWKQTHPDILQKMYLKLHVYMSEHTHKHRYACMYVCIYPHPKKNMSRSNATSAPVGPVHMLSTYQCSPCTCGGLISFTNRHIHICVYVCVYIYIYI